MLWYLTLYLAIGGLIHVGLINWYVPTLRKMDEDETLDDIGKQMLQEYDFDPLFRIKMFLSCLVFGPVVFVAVAIEYFTGIDIIPESR